MKESLGDEAELDVAMVSIEFALDAFSVFEGFAVKVLISRFAGDGFHGHHPEVVGEGAEGAKCLLERDFDFEANSVEADDVDGWEKQVGGKENYFPAGGVINSNETDDAGEGLPKQVDGEVAEGDVGFVVDGTLGLNPSRGIFEKHTEANLFSVDARAAAP